MFFCFPVLTNIEQPFSSNHSVEELFNCAITSVNHFLCNQKGIFIDSNMSLTDVYAQRAEIAIQVQLAFLNAFKIPVTDNSQQPTDLEMGGLSEEEVVDDD